MKKYYIAYGSNLSVAQMAQRCPDARPVGTAILKDWRLVFRVHATIEPCEGHEVPAGIWEISDKDERALDMYEGFPRYYYKQHMTISMQSFVTKRRRKIKGMVYVMCLGRAIKPPMRSYYDIIREGYDDFGFDIEYLIDALGDSIQYKNDMRIGRSI